MACKTCMKLSELNYSHLLMKQKRKYLKCIPSIQWLRYVVNIFTWTLLYGIEVKKYMHTLQSYLIKRTIICPPAARSSCSRIGLMIVYGTLWWLSWNIMLQTSNNYCIYEAIIITIIKLVLHLSLNTFLCNVTIQLFLWEKLLAIILNENKNVSYW